MIRNSIFSVGIWLGEWWISAVKKVDLACAEAGRRFWVPESTRWQKDDDESCALRIAKAINGSLLTRRQICEQKVICCTTLTKIWPIINKNCGGEYPTPMLILLFFLQKTPIAMRYAPFLCNWKSEKTENARLFRCWDREQAGRHVEKWGGGKSIPKPRRYAIKNQVLGINHQKDPSKMLKTPRNSNRFSESKSESETKHQPLCWKEKKCHQKHQSLCWKEKSDTQNANRYAEEERGAIQNAGRYAEEERIAIQNTGRYAENEEQKGRIRIA